MRTHMNISSYVCSYADARRIQSTSYAADLYACICTQACTAYRQDGTHAHAEILYSVLIIFLLCSGQTLDALLFRLQHRFLGGLQNCGESALSGSRVLYSLYSAPNKIHMFQETRVAALLCFCLAEPSSQRAGRPARADLPSEPPWTARLAPITVPQCIISKQTDLSHQKYKQQLIQVKSPQRRLHCVELKAVTG